MRRARKLLARSQSGLTLVETMVAAALLLVGLLGTVKLIDVASSSQGDAKAREGATNLAREVLEDAHDTAFKQVGATGWITPSLQSLSNDTNATNTVTTPTSSSVQTTLTRRKIPYTVNVSWCSVDDSKDGYGVHSGSINWCSDSTTTGTGDSAPEDLKRVTAAVTYSINGNAKTLSETVTFSATGGMVAPSVQSLCASGTPIGAGTNCTGPWTITDATATSQSFIGTAPGAADMKFAVNGVEATTGITNNGNGTWTYAWPIALASLPDGTYSISATAVDALGNRSQSISQTVKLARGSTVTVANVVGGYNYVNPTGIGNGGSLVVELGWDASGAGSVTGYQVLRGATSVCGGQTSLAISCIDASPPTTGTTTYTIKTWYQDANGNPQSASTTYNVTAPTTSAIPTKYYLTYDASNPKGSYTGSGCSNAGSTGSQFDMPSTAPNFTAMSSGAGWVAGCLPPFPAGISLGTGNFVLAAKWLNTSTTSDCSGLPFYIVLNGTTAIAGSGINGAPNLPGITKNHTSSNPLSTSTNFKDTPQSFAPGDQLSIYTALSTFSSNCSQASMYFDSSTQVVSITAPLTGNVSTLSTPAAPTGLTVTANADGTRTLTWTAVNNAGGASPDFYRIYRDGTATSARIDTADAVNTTLTAASNAGASSVTVANPTDYAVGDTVLVDNGTSEDTMTIASISGNTITFTTTMAHAHQVGDPLVKRTITWTDTTASSSHTYRVTAASQNLAESSFAGPVTG